MPTAENPAVVVHGDCQPTMAGMGSASVDLIVADPPFGARRPSAWRLADQQFAEIHGNDSVNGDWLTTAFYMLRDGGALYLFACWDK